MYKIIRKEGKTILHGLGESDSVQPGDRNITDLDCADLVVLGKFDVSGNRTLKSLKNGPQETASYVAALCGLESLDCRELKVLELFRVSDNKELKTLRGGPLAVDEYHAGNCDLVALDCGETVVSRVLRIFGNPNLRSLRGCPKAARIETDAGQALLFAVGRVPRITLGVTGSENLAVSVFRCKLDLILRGRKINAKFIRA